MKPIAKRITCLLLALTLLGSLAGCRASDMPFNGGVAFHELKVTIPDSFLRDSGQSSEDLWIFEKGGYQQIILLSRRDAPGDVGASLDDYAAYLLEQGMDARRGSFLELDAVLSSCTMDGVFCQEVLFAHGGSFYAVSLRGGTREEFQSLLDTVAISDGR